MKGRMMIITCPSCQKTFEVKPEFAGETVICSGCKVRFIIPSVFEAEACPPVYPPVLAKTPATIKRPALKTAMLIFTDLWVLAMVSAIAFSVYWTFHDSEAAEVLRKNPSPAMALILQSLLLCFLVTIPYTIIMVALSVWNFCSKRN